MDADFLKEQKENILEAIGKVSKILERPVDPHFEKGDELDQLNDELDGQKQIRFRMRNWSYLKKLQNAFKKIENKEYGCCSSCGDDIAEERLSARPTADFCIFCQEEKELLIAKSASRNNVLTFPREQRQRLSS
jgi:DnaK suppressor protein